MEFRDDATDHVAYANDTPILDPCGIREWMGRAGGRLNTYANDGEWIPLGTTMVEDCDFAEAMRARSAWKDARRHCTKAGRDEDWELTAAPGVFGEIPRAKDSVRLRKHGELQN